MKTIFSLLVVCLVIQTSISLRLIGSGPRPADCYGSFTGAETFCEFYSGQTGELFNSIFLQHYSEIEDETVPQGCILKLQWSAGFGINLLNIQFNSHSNVINCSSSAFCVCADSNVTQADVDAAIAECDASFTEAECGQKAQNGEYGALLSSSSCQTLKTTYNQNSCC